jgi:hypothetical protein
MAITIEKVIPNPDKPHAPYVRLVLDDGTAVEFTVRKVHYDSLTTAGKLAYAKECREYHSPTARGQREARRAIWDADDLAVEQAKFIMRHIATTDEGVTVSVTWKGLTAEHVIPNDPANATANAQAAHQAVLDAKAAEAEATAAFNVG